MCLVEIWWVFSCVVWYPFDEDLARFCWSLEAHRQAMMSWTPQRYCHQAPAPGDSWLACCPGPCTRWGWPLWTILSTSQVRQWYLYDESYLNINALFFAGGVDGDNKSFDEILKFKTDTEEWILAGKMNKKRESHAVSTINYGDVSDHCTIWLGWHLEAPLILLHSDLLILYFFLH